MFKIDKGIPTPGRTNINKYPFKDLSIGDSFFVPLDGETKYVVRQRLSNAMTYHRTHSEFIFVSKFENDGFRIWRVK